MSVSLSLLGAFAVRIGGAPVHLAPVGQRVVALLALSGRSAKRERLAGTLWPERPEGRALANLRGVLHRFPNELRGGIEGRGRVVAMSPTWTVDLDAASCHATPPDAARAADVELLTRDLLPDWDEDWLVIPRERYRQYRLHALEDLATEQLAAGRALDAVDTAMHALAAEPLRESAQLLVLRAHLAAGNRASAVELFDRFRAMLATELGVLPSDEMCREVASIGGR
jgi:DNA-binding SARP family transcriptional activator